MEELIAESNNHLDRALHFFQTTGISLSYRPTIGYQSKSNMIPDQTFAEINGELECADATNELINMEIYRHAFNEIYLLNVSDSALQEYNNIISKFVKKSQSNPYPSDITIFDNYSKVPEKIRYRVIKHELWHLIEKERGLINTHPHIIEGTATFVMHPRNTFTEYSQPKMTMFELRYEPVAKLVEEHTKSLENPYQAILEPKLRDEITSSYIQMMKNMISEEKEYSEMFKHPDVKELMLQIFPELDKLRTKMDKDTLINVLRNSELPLLAEELKDQDLSKLLSSYAIMFSSNI